MNEIQTLEHMVGGIAIRDMTAITFYQWVAKKLNNVLAYSSAATELRLLVQNPPMARTISDDEKLRIMAKMVRAGIEIK